MAKALPFALEAIIFVAITAILIVSLRAGENDRDRPLLAEMILRALERKILHL